MLTPVTGLSSIHMTMCHITITFIWLTSGICHPFFSDSNTCIVHPGVQFKFSNCGDFYCTLEKDKFVMWLLSKKDLITDISKKNVNDLNLACHRKFDLIFIQQYGASSSRLMVCHCDACVGHDSLQTSSRVSRIIFDEITHEVIR